MSRYQTEFHTPELSDWSNYELWEEQGRTRVIDRATHAWKELLEAYEPPPIDDAIREELVDYVARRKTEIGTAEIA